MTSTLPPLQVCEQARLTRDARFDGLFFTAVKTTGIYCRPVCPAPAPRAENVEYHPSAASAEAAGFRPCLRCRPELSPAGTSWRRADTLVSRALRMMEDTCPTCHATSPGTSSAATSSLSSPPAKRTTSGAGERKTLEPEACEFLPAAQASRETPASAPRLSITAIARRLHISERHLRRLFQESFGVSPQQVHDTRRLLFAKQLLTETRLSVIQVAEAAGFGSLRRFNDAFLNAYGMPPSRIRKSGTGDADSGDTRPPDARQKTSRHASTHSASPEPASSATLRQHAETLTLKLAYRPPFDFSAALKFLRLRALPGVEHIDDTCYVRLFDADGAWLSVSAWDDEVPALKLQVHHLRPSALAGVVQHVRRVFDLDANPQAIQDQLGKDPALAPLVSARPGLRLPGGWQGFEVVARAILGQQVSVAAGITLARRLVTRYGQPLHTNILIPGTHGNTPIHLHSLFPSPERIASLSVDDIRSIGLPQRRAGTLLEFSRALCEGRISLENPPPLEEFIAQLTRLPGIGDWTAHYIAMRALSHPDAFPAGDLVLRKQMTLSSENTVPLEHKTSRKASARQASPSTGTNGAPSLISTKQLLQRAEAWRPWRAYAVIHLWHAASTQAEAIRDR
ncbi:MAG: AlkA N-terminal domain-containing protein [Lautropia sp.]|nr:AlkA N-terminal domain-containing protein [Lautropia sp.]